MKDIHTHILYGIDDGVKTLDESLEILTNAYQNGIRDIVLTPHYIKDSKFSTNNEIKSEILEVIKEELNKRNIYLNLYLGNEVYIDLDIVSLLEKDEITTINGGKYILMELPLNNKSLILDEVVYNLRKVGIIPIIAHPERYLNYYEDYEFFADLIKKGCLMQANVGSLYGMYGKKCKKMVKGLLKRDMIHFFGSDIHSEKSDIYQKTIEKDLLKIVKSEEKVQKLLNENVEKVLKNQVVR